LILKRTESIIHVGFRVDGSDHTRIYLTELIEKHGVFDIVFLVDDTGDLIGVFDEKTSATASTNTASEIPLNMFSAR